VILRKLAFGEHTYKRTSANDHIWFRLIEQDYRQGQS